MLDLDQIKASNPIEGIINADEPLEQTRGRYRRGTQHDSLVVDTLQGTYYWNSRGEWGDAIEWLEKRRGLDFRGAVEELCRRAGLPAPEWGGQDAQAVAASRRQADTLTIAARHWVRVLRKTPAAMEYCAWRGWTEETIREAGLGYVDGDAKALRGELQMHNVDLQSGAARAILATPAGMLVYPCVRGGRVVYFLCRTSSQEEKRHWNPPLELVGARQRYFNFAYHPLADLVVVVEGPADAITLAQWGIGAVALAGTGLGPDELRALLGSLRHHQTIVVGLDQDAQVTTLGDAIGPLARILRWPAKDPNEWLQDGATVEDCHALIASATTWAETTAAEAGKAEGTERPAALRRVFALFARMDDFAMGMLRPELAQSLGMATRQFNVLLKAAREEHAPEESDEGPTFEVEMPGGWVAGHLLEMIATPPVSDHPGQAGTGWQTKLACRFPQGEIRIIPHLDVNGVRYLPIRASNPVITERVVLFPSALGERKTLRELVRWVQSVIRRYVDVDVFYETLAAYYVLFSWQFDSFNTVPYLRLLGDAGTGKSRFIQVVGAMCFRPIFVTGAATTSPIFRLLDRYRGTLICDEMDFRASDEAADVIKIFNTGYQRTQGVVLRSGDKTAGFETEVFVVYGPKIIATRKRFNDWALESRCLTHETGGPTTRTDIPVDLPMTFWTDETQQIRNALLRYRLEYWKPQIELDYSQMDASVEPRLNQVTVALQTLIDDADLQADLRQFIQEYNRQLIVERGMTLSAKTLEALCGLWFGDLNDNRVPELSMKRVAKAVNTLIDYENEGAGEGDAETEEQRRGGDERPRVTPKKVGEIVRKQLHLRTERRSDQGRAYVVIWDAERVEALRRRFGLDEEWLADIMKILREGLLAQGTMRLDADGPPPLIGD